MSNPQTSSWPDSSSASPRIALEVRASRRVQIAVALFAVAMFVALVLSPEPAWICKAFAGTLAAVLGAPSVFKVVFGRGSNAIRRIEWNAAGVWHLFDASGRGQPAKLLPASATLGPWLLLIFEGPGRSTRYVLIDAATSDPRAFRALKGHLNC